MKKVYVILVVGLLLNYACAVTQDQNDMDDNKLFRERRRCRSYGEWCNYDSDCCYSYHSCSSGRCR